MQPPPPRHLSASDVESALEAARAAATRAEEADYRRSNPRRASSEARTSVEAASNLEFWQWAASEAPRARALGLDLAAAPQGSFPRIFVVSPDGRRWPTGRDSLDGLLETMSDPERYAAFVQERDLAAARQPMRMSDLQRLLPGTKRRGFQDRLLAEAGPGPMPALIIRHEGTYGPYYSVTHDGIRWAYDLYLRGEMPMARGKSPAPVPELDERLDPRPSPTTGPTGP